MNNNFIRISVFIFLVFLAGVLHAGKPAVRHANKAIGKIKPVNYDFLSSEKLSLSTYNNFKRIFQSTAATPPIYSKHYIAPAPWQYWSKANQIVITTESTAPVSGTITKSDGTSLFSFSCSAGIPYIQRFNGRPGDLPVHPLNMVVSGGGLFVIANGSIAVNLRNIASDDLGNDGNDANIKGNASLFSFGDAGVGTAFRVGYYRDGDLAGSERPIYSVMALDDDTEVKIAGVKKANLNKGQSYLFQCAIGTLVESTRPTVMNTSARLDAPGGCGDGAYNPIPPISSLGSEYVIVRGEGNPTAEQTTIVATEANTTGTIEYFDDNGNIKKTEPFVISQAGGTKNFAHGYYTGNYNSVSNTGKYSSSRIVTTKNVVVFSGTAGASGGAGCEVDIATLIPIANCAGSRTVETAEFTDYTDGKLPYFGYILTKSSDEIKLTTKGGSTTYTSKNIESIPGIVKRPLGSSGLFLVKFTDANIGLPKVITISSTSRLTVSMVQQSNAFSMSNFISRFPEKASQPTVDLTNCAAAILTAEASSEGPYKWFFNGVEIQGAVSNTYTATVSGNYTVSSMLDCGLSAQSLPLIISLCSIDRAIEKTVDKSLPELGETVTFKLTARNFGQGKAIGVSVTDRLPEGYEYVTHSPFSENYNPTTGVWTIGDLASGASSVLEIKAKVIKVGQHTNTATITGTQPDVNPTNDIGTASTITELGVITLISPAPDRTVCISTPIEEIVYSVGGGASGVTVTGLPAGFTQDYNSETKELKITGSSTTPTGPEGVIYTVTTTGGIPVSKTGRIIVKADVSRPVFSDNLTISRCVGAGNNTYIATAQNSDGIAYELAPVTAGVIDRATGAVTWSQSFEGIATITAIATGCNEKQSVLQVTVNPVPAAPVASPVTYCQNEVARPLMASGINLTWYDANGVLPGAPTPLTATAGITDYYVTQKTTEGCESPRTKVTVTVNPVLAAPVASPVTYCQNEVARPLMASGINLTWYDSNGVLPGAPTPLTATAGITDYYVTQKTTEGCESPRTKVTVTVNPVLAAPVASPVTYCQNEVARPLMASGINLTWYDANGALPGAPTPLTATAGITDYYVTQKTTEGCESPRTKVTVTVNPVLAAPVASPVTYCQNEVARPLMASGINLTWYDSNGVLPGAPTPLTATAGITDYYVTQKTTEGCESQRTKVTVTVNPVPAAPVASPVTYCQNEVARPLMASGINLTWYDSNGALPGAPTPLTATAGITDYYVTQKTTEGCESPRTKVTVTVNPVLAAPVASPVTYCQNEVARPLMASGINLTWYDANGALPGAPTPLTATAGITDYYVTQKTTEGCESPRTKVTVTVNPVLGAPVASPVTYCQNEVARPLMASGINLAWYDANGTRLDAVPVPSTSSIGETSYFVTQRISATGCESEKAKLIVTVNALPVAPVTEHLTYCKNQQYIPVLTADGSNLTWYDANGTKLNAAPIPSTSSVGETKYYVTQKNAEGCEGPKAELKVTIIALPNAPLTAHLTYCQNRQNIPALTADGSNLTWYDVNGTKLNAAPVPSTSSVGETKYYVTQKNAEGCEGPKAELKVTVIALPLAPVTAHLTYCQNLQNIPGLTANGSNLTWYDANGTKLNAAPIPSTSSVGETKYYVTQKNAEGCEGPKAELKVTVIALPLAPGTRLLTYCQNRKNIPALTANGSNLTWYDANGTKLNAAPVPSTSSVGETKYYVTQKNAEGCEGPKAELKVTVIALPLAPGTRPLTYCQNETNIPALTADGENLKWYDEQGNLLNHVPIPSTSIHGIKNYYVTQSNSSGCESAKAKIAITIIAKPGKPTVSASGPVVICQGGSVILKSSLSDFYQWFKDGVALNGENTQTLNVSRSGKYSIVTSNSGGCTSESSELINVNVIPVPQKPAITHQGALNICEGDVVVLKSSVTDGNQWFKDNVLIPGATAQTYVAKEEGQYSVSVNTLPGCASPLADPVSVTVNSIEEAPVINTQSDLVICKGGTATLKSSASTGNQWYKDGVLIPGAVGATYIAASSGKYTVKHKNLSGCESPGSNAIDLVEQPFKISLDANTNVASYGSKVVLKVGSNLKYKILSWSPSNLFQDIDARSQTIVLEKDVKITINAVSENGCLASATVAIQLKKTKDLYIPNTFTPNGDGKNDVIKVYGTDIEMIEWAVYSQWGQLIYRSKAQDASWDGTFRGVVQPVGVYVYKCVVRFRDGEEVTKHGSINLVR